MKRLLISILLSLTSFLLLGQMFPMSDHYLTDALGINPAFAGCHDALSASIMYRNQWTGFRDAPKSYLMSVHAPLSRDRVGAGLLVEKNSIGIFKETSIMGNYAYRMQVRNGRLALGLGFGLTVHNIAWNELIASDPGDTQLMDSQATSILPEFSLGGYYYNKKFFLGLSLPLLLTHEQDNSTGKYKTGSNFSGSNFFLNSGYNFDINRNIRFLPSVLIRYHPGNAIQADLNAIVDLKEKIRVGLGYRSSKNIAGILQCQINYQLSIGYTYQYYIGTIGKYMNGSHEVAINYKFRYTRFVKGPRQF